MNPAHMLIERVLVDMVAEHESQCSPYSDPARILVEDAEDHQGFIQTFAVRISVAAVNGDADDATSPDFLQASYGIRVLDCLSVVAGHVWGENARKHTHDACIRLRHIHPQTVAERGVW